MEVETHDTPMQSPWDVIEPLTGWERNLRRLTTKEIKDFCVRA